jgi:biotin operon repressor
MANILNDMREMQIRRGKSETFDGVLYVGVGIGLFTAEHMRRMGTAIYTYGRLISKVTGWTPRYLLGAVLKGAPLKLSTLADQSQISERTVRRHVKQLEAEGYVITVRKQRGLAFFITNYRPFGKPNLGIGECPERAVLRLSELTDEGLVRGHMVADSEGINKHLINTCNADLNHDDALYLQPNAEIYFLMLRLFHIGCGSAELRFFFRGRKKTKSFVQLDEFLKAVGRTLLAHERKQANQERAGHKVTGITNILAYLNSGLHGPVPYLLKSVRGDETYIERVFSMYYAIRDEVAEYKNKRNIELGKRAS